MSATLIKMAEDADLILAGSTYQPLAANVAEFYGIPLSVLHHFSQRRNRVILADSIPSLLAKPIWDIAEWTYWQLLKPAEQTQRKTLGLKSTIVNPFQRMQEQGALEIQAYDEALFPGISKEFGPQRPVVGAISLETNYQDDEAALE